MSETLKGSHLNDEELEKILIALYHTMPEHGCHQRFLDQMKDIRDQAYSIGYRHGHKDKLAGD